MVEEKQMVINRDRSFHLIANPFKGGASVSCKCVHVFKSQKFANCDSNMFNLDSPEGHTEMAKR